jgi:hypothetical protein
LAVSSFKDVITRAPHQHWGHLGLATVYVRLGKMEKAAIHVNMALELDPEMSLAKFAAGDRFYRDPEILEGILNDLRQAGLK